MLTGRLTREEDVFPCVLQRLYVSTFLQDTEGILPFFIQPDPGSPLSRAKAQVTLDVDARTATAAKINMATSKVVNPVANPLSSSTNTK
jgi:hypothetical protein